MALQQIMERLSTERKVGSRFPVRMIFMDSFKQYNELLHGLSKSCETTLHLASFCAGEDHFPNFHKMMIQIEENEGKHILLLSLHEYLRFGIKRELKIQELSSLWQKLQNSSSRTRVIIPMLACRDLWERVVPVDERQKDHVWILESPLDSIQPLKLEIYSEDFSSVLSNNEAVHGFKDWLLNWNQFMGRPDTTCKVVTRLWSHAENTTSVFETQVICDVFSYIQANLQDGNTLKKEWGINQQWLSLLPALKQGKSVSHVIETLLNVLIFDPLSMLTKWQFMSDEQRWLVWLWYRINSTNDYYSYAIKQAIAHTEVAERLAYSIFDMSARQVDWIDQRHKAMKALGFEPSEEFFRRVDSLPLMESRLALLTCETHPEKAYAIKTVSQWLRKGADINEVSDRLQDKYRLFSQYLTLSSSAYNTQLTNYFSWYRKHKVMNSLPEHTEDTIETVSVYSFDSRYSILKQLEEKNALVLWVDGMGAEWLPLLEECVKENSLGTIVTSKVTQSMLPTETSYNEQWKDMGIAYRKINKLDILAHKGMPDDKNYFSCIAHQIAEIRNIAKLALSLLKEYDYVAITADHGTSRLAALAFHNLPGISAPAGAKVKSYGRYCELDRAPRPNDIAPGTLPATNTAINFLVFTTYGHYAQQGNAAGVNDADTANVGEVHGGAAPEEVLVPVIIMKRKTPIQQLEVSLLTPTVYRDKGPVTVQVRCTRQVVTLTASASGINAICSANEEGTDWQLIFNGLGLQQHDLQLEADGKVIATHQTFTVKARGISEDKDLLGGL